MSYQNSQYIEIKDVFTAGFVDNVSNHQMVDKYSPFLRDCRIVGRGIGKRPGHSLFHQFGVGGETPLGIASYDHSDASLSRLVVRFNADATHHLTTFKEDGTVLAIDTTGLITVDDRMNFLNIGDVLYTFNGTDKIGKLSGTTFTQVTQAFAGPIPAAGDLSPSFGVHFDGKMWVSGWKTNSDFVFFSNGNEPENFLTGGADQIQFREHITGLASNTQTLFYFTRNSISVTDTGDIIDVGGTITYRVRSLQVQEGAVNHNSIVSVGNRTYYLTPSNKINQVARGTSIGGYEALELSDRQYAGITNIMKTLDSDQSDSFGYYIPKEDIIKWHLKSEGSTFNDICIVYDLTNDAFLVDRRKFFFGGAVFKGQAYTISMLEDKVYKDEFGNTDEATPVLMEYRTKEFDLGEVTRNKQFWESRIYLGINSLTELVQDIYVDGKQVDSFTITSACVPGGVSTGGGIGDVPIGDFAIGDPEDDGLMDELSFFAFVRTKGYLQNKGKTIQFRYRDEALASEIQIQTLEVRAEILTPMNNNLTCS